MVPCSQGKLGNGGCGDRRPETTRGLMGVGPDVAPISGRIAARLRGNRGAELYFVRIRTSREWRPICVEMLVWKGLLSVE